MEVSGIMVVEEKKKQDDEGEKQKFKSRTKWRGLNGRMLEKSREKLVES